MADRDVTLDVLMRDKTSPAIKSVNRNLKSVEKSWKDVDNQGKRTLAAAQKIAGDWGRGFSRISGATSRWANSGDTAGKKFVKGLGSGIEKLGDIGSSIGKGLSSAVSAAGPYVQVAMAAILVAAAASAAPAIAGAIVGGAAGVGVVGGLLIASKDPRVAGAFESLKRDISSQLGDAASSFGPAAIEAVGIARRAFQQLMPDLRRLFDSSSGFVAPLTRGLGDGIQGALSGIVKAVEKAGPIIEVVGNALGRIGRAIGDVFERLSDNGTSMAAALKAAFMVVEGAIYLVGLTLNAMVEAFEWFVSKIPGGEAALKRFVGSSDTAKGSANGLAGGFRLLGSDANTAAAGIANAKQKAQEFADSNISLSNAQIASREAIRSTTKAIEENGKAKIGNAEKADRNMKALNDLATAFNTETTAGEKSGISAGKASEAYATNRQALLKAANAAGIKGKAADKLVASLLKIPKNVNTDVNVNTETGMTKLETLQKKIKNTKGKTVTITVQVLSNGNHRMPGGGQLTFDGAAYQSWQGAGGDTGTSRTGGPTKVESTVNQTLNVSLDGQPFYSFTAQAINDSQRRHDWRKKMARR